MLLSHASANINSETGIAYGAINARNLDQDVYISIYDQVDPDGSGYEPEGEFVYQLDKELDGTDEQITGVLTWLGGAPLLLITWSPLTRCVSPCSPCLPNAGDLDSGDVAVSDGVECYAVHYTLLAENEA